MHEYIFRHRDSPLWRNNLSTKSKFIGKSIFIFFFQTEILPANEVINFTGFEYDNEETLQIMKKLANDLVNYLDNDKVYEVHCDPKKRKLMIRVNGNMIFKIFVQKNCYKIHLKHKVDFEQFKFINQNEVFYQNGFNLPYAYKTDLDTVHKIVKAIA